MSVVPGILQKQGIVSESLVTVTGDLSFSSAQTIKRTFGPAFFKLLDCVYIPKFDRAVVA